MRNIVIVDVGIPELENNKLFDQSVAQKVSHTLIPICHLKKQAEKHDIEFITSDVFLNNPKDFKKTKIFLISYLTSINTKKILESGVKPLVLICTESPFIATRFYVNLKKYSSYFKYSILFSGMRKMVSKKTIFIPMYFPQFFSREKFIEVPFYKKKFLVYIASSKNFHNFIKIFIIRILYGYNIKLIYKVRKKIIKLMSQNSDFDLYGRGWKKKNDEYIKKCYLGEIDNKEKKLREYKFVLCLENTIFPGYITEKIFDSFFALSIPVYLGAPDIANFIPKNTFIDINDFKNIDDLNLFLHTISEEQYEQYITNIKAFLNSSDYHKFSHEKFSSDILNIIKNEFINE